MRLNWRLVLPARAPMRRLGGQQGLVGWAQSGLGWWESETAARSRWTSPQPPASDGSGPGAADAIRALLVTAMAAHIGPDPDSAADVVVTAADLAELLDHDPHLSVPPAGLRVVPILGDALELLET